MQKQYMWELKKKEQKDSLIKGCYVQKSFISSYIQTFKGAIAMDYHKKEKLKN